MIEGIFILVSAFIISSYTLYKIGEYLESKGIW